MINIKNKLLTNRFDIYVFLDVDIDRLQHYTNYAFLRAPHKHLVQFPKRRPCDLIFSGNCIVCIVQILFNAYRSTRNSYYIKFKYP